MKSKTTNLPPIQNTQYTTTTSNFNNINTDSVVTQNNKKPRNTICPSKSSNIGFLEIFNHPHLKKLKEKLEKLPAKQREAYKYESKIQLPIIESIVFEQGLPSYWLFTDSNGYVMKRSFKKLNKEYLLFYFQKCLIEYCIRNKETPFNYSEKKLMDDLSKYCILIEQKYDNNILTEELKYLEKIISKKFILIMSYTEEKLFNVIELNRYLLDGNKIAQINLIQNFIHINIGSKPIMCKFFKKDTLSPKHYLVFTVKPKNTESEEVDDYDFRKTWNKKFRAQNSFRVGATEPDYFVEEREKDLFQDVIKLYDANLTSQVERISNEFIRFYERLEKIDIGYFLLNFFKTLDGRLVFSGAEKIMFTSKFPEKSEMEKLYLETYETKKPLFEGLNKRAACMGDFCDYDIPKSLKNNKNLDKALGQYSITEVKTKEKKSSIIFVSMIKKVYDNPNLVDLVLKAYSIYPKNFKKEILFNSKTTFEQIFKPSKQKFKCVNMDTIYSETAVCSSCYLVYILITNFLGNIDENNSSCKDF